MSAFFPEPPHQPEPAIEISPELRDYVLACVRAARPSRSRDEALRLLGAVDLEDAWELPSEPVDWDEVEAEARRQGCTVADVIYDRAGRGL